MKKNTNQTTISPVQRSEIRATVASGASVVVTSRSLVGATGLVASSSKMFQKRSA